MTQTPEYATWRRMKTRCYNPRFEGFQNYGGRGIKVCDRWRNSFANFIADMGPKPSPKHSIDRIDNDGNYTPTNCRWATRELQSNNRQVNHYLTHNGKTRGISAWARDLGCSPNAITMRLARGWSDEMALTIPINKSEARKRANVLRDAGIFKTIPIRGDNRRKTTDRA